MTRRAAVDVIEPTNAVDAAEQAVLSAMFLDPNAIPVAQQYVDRMSFVRTGHRALFGAITALHSRGVTVDPLTLSDELERRDELQIAGGRDYVAYLIDVVVTGANVAHHATIVRTAAKLRTLRDLADRVRLAAEQPGADPVALARTLQDETLGLAVEADTAGFREVTVADFEALEAELNRRAGAIAAGTLPGLPTGFSEIDDVTLGFRDGELVILGAVPKAWKSALVDNIGLNLLHAGYPGAMVSAEMPRAQQLERLIATEATIPLSTLARGTLTETEWQRYGYAARLLVEDLHIDDEAFPELGDVVARCTAVKARHPKIRWMKVDYLQLVAARAKGMRGDEEIAVICKALKGLGKRLEVLMLVPAQCNYKEIDARPDKRPDLRDLQGGSAMAQTADFVGLLYNPLLYEPNAPKVLEVHWAATRRTPKWTAKLAMHPEYQLLRSLRPAIRDRVQRAS